MNTNSTTYTFENVMNFLLSQPISKQRMALIQLSNSVGKKNLPPYTIEELEQRIEQSENEIEAGNGISHQDAMKQMQEYLHKLA